MNLFHILSWSGTISRKHFLIWGVFLFAVKYNFDRLIALYFDKNWIIINYFLATEEITGIKPGSPDFNFYLTLLVVSLPFIYWGTVLTVKRLRDAGKSDWLVLFFFLPFINILMFSILLALKSEDSELGYEPGLLNRFRPESKFGSAVFALAVTTLIALGLSLVFVNQFESYGWGVFVGIPFFLGFGTVLTYGRAKQITFRGAIGLGILSVTLFSLTIFILAVEGIICISMAYPILLVLATIGSLLAYGITKGASTATLNSLIFPLIAIPMLSASEVWIAPEAKTTSVTTEIIVDASQQAVWNQLVAFSKIDAPKEFIFQTGLAYPTHAEIEGFGEGAVRKCNFTTGAFIEPITIWKEPELLEFSVLDQPPPMIENSPYGNLQVPHLDGYFKSHKGQFRLELLPDGKTKLVGTTWYSHNIYPGFYWRIWSDFILHKIHYRVLNHIKVKSETE